MAEVLRMEPGILYEDNHLLAVNKPFNMPSQDDPSGDQSVNTWAMEYIRKTYSKPGNVYVALLHRLDRPAGGVLLLAKTSKAAERMSKLFHDRKIEKRYWAITERTPVPAEGSLQHYVKKIADKNIMQAFKKEVHASQKAVLHYKVLKTLGERALVEVQLETGRRHQIRVQLGAINCPIMGDVKYGKTDFLHDLSIALLAKEVRFVHPVTQVEIQIEAPIPDKEPWSSFS